MTFQSNDRPIPYAPVSLGSLPKSKIAEKFEISFTQPISEISNYWVKAFETEFGVSNHADFLLFMAQSWQKNPRNTTQDPMVYALTIVQKVKAPGPVLAMLLWLVDQGYGDKSINDILTETA